MATGVNVKMGVSGVSQFKNNMNQAKQAVKTLDAQLALSEKQFKQTGDSESYMTEKAELLKAKLEQQKQIVNNAEKALEDMRQKGVDTSSKSYQDLYRQMVQAKGAMIDTENAINGVTDSSADAAGAVEKMSNELGDIDKNVSYQNVTNALDKITGGMETVMKKAVQLGKAITKEVLGAGSWADDLNTRASYYEIDQEKLQRMEKTANLIDTSVESIIKSRKKLMTSVGKGNSSVDDVLSSLGIQYAGDAEDTFWKAGEAIMNLTDEAEREAKANALFGRSWSELIPLFEAGREKYDKLNESWSVVPQEQIDALQEMDDQYQKLNAELETVKMTFLGELAPAVTGVMGTISTLLEQFNEYLKTENGQQMMESLSSAVTGLFEDLANIDPENVGNTVTGILNGIKDALQWIAENKGAVKTGVEVFIGAWAALKVAEGVTTALQLINGIKSLTGGGASLAGTIAGHAWGGAFATAIMKASPFLAFLYTLLKPSAGSDKLGNNTLFGENGDLTDEAKAMGWRKVESTGEVVQDPNLIDPSLVDPDYLKTLKLESMTEDRRQMLKRLSEAGGDTGDWTGEAITAEEQADLMAKRRNSARQLDDALGRMEETAADGATKTEGLQKSTDNMKDAAEDMSKTAKNLPGLMQNLLSGMKVVMDDQVVGQIVSEVIASQTD